MNVEGCHTVVVWQVEQSLEKPADTCAGFVVPLKFAWWQLTQAVDVEVKLLLMWHAVHGVTVACAPVSANPIAEWSNVAGCQDVVVWQVVQSVENPWWDGFVAALKFAW